MKHILTFAVLVFATACFGQCATTTSTLPGYNLSIELVSEHTSGTLDGQRTYRIYVETPSESDVLVAVYGDDDGPLVLSTSTSFYQSTHGSAVGGTVSPATINSFPESAFDSYVTIGATTSADAQGGLVTTIDYSSWGEDFEAGNSFLIQDSFGAGWYMAPPGQANSVAGEDKRVLVAQLTSDGVLSGQMRMQILPDGNISNDVRPYFTFTMALGEGCGCTDEEAYNYESSAEVDDGTCVYNPCFNAFACNFDPEQEWNEGPCEYPSAGYDCNGNCLEDFDGDSICDLFDPCVGEFDQCGVCNGPGAVYECGCAEVSVGECDCNGAILDAIGICGGDCPEDDDNNGVCDNEEIFGCTYELANNFNVLATRDDGLCAFPCSGDINQNVFDWDGDSAVTIADFLAILSVFGDVDVDVDGIWDSLDECTDVSACNYSESPSQPCQYLDVTGICGGGCLQDVDVDGVCDDVDSCVGTIDECGVCNGPGPTEVMIEDITILYDSVYLPQLDEWYVYEFGADTTFSFECVPEFTCGDPLEYQGYDYETVQIGEQCWFAENLRTLQYSDDSPITSGLTMSEWWLAGGETATYGGVDFCYAPDPSLCDTNITIDFGRLYNWQAVIDPRGLCPSGWSVPSDEQWMTLEQFLGMSEIQVQDTMLRGDLQGHQLKSTFGWTESGNGSNELGFNARPGGTINLWNGSSGIQQAGVWWTSTEEIHTYTTDTYRYAWVRGLYSYSSQVYRGDVFWGYGNSVRCLKDSE